MHQPDDEFAIPIVRLWEHLLVPIQGEISDQQAAELSADVLEAVHRTGATNLLIDVSGVAVMDSHLCATFARLAASARMMGVHSVISGLTPEIVMTLQTMGVELEDIRTTLSLEEALMMLGIGKLTPMAPVAQPTMPYPQPAPYGSPSPATGSYGAAPPSGPGTIPPPASAPGATAAWASSGAPPHTAGVGSWPPTGAPPRPGGGLSPNGPPPGPPFGRPASQGFGHAAAPPFGPVGYQKKGDLDE